MAIDRLTVIYDADGGLLGELRYVADKLLNGAHCSACDITHGAVSEKGEWKSCKARLPVPVDQLHRNELEPELDRAVQGQLPCVAAHDDDGWSVLVTADELDELRGSASALEALLQERLG